MLCDAIRLYTMLLHTPYDASRRYTKLVETLDGAIQRYSAVVWLILSSLEFTCNIGESITLEGWRTEIRQGDAGDYTVYISPEGESFDSLQYAHDAIQNISCNTAEKTTALAAMRCLLVEFKEGHSLEPTEPHIDSVTAAASRGGNATGFALSQLDDYLHRGTHALVKDMSLYIYSMWVYRAEKTPFAQDASLKHERKLRHIDIAFHETYAAARTWIQRIAKEPRVPKPEGYRFITEVDSEMHYLLKAILLRPIYLPEQPDSDETRQMILLRAYRDLCTPPENEPPWTAFNGGVGFLCVNSWGLQMPKHQILLSCIIGLALYRFNVESRS